MPPKKKFEQQFFNALRDIFVGARVEGDSGFINLMHIKSRYYEQGVFPQLKKDIDVVLQPFPDFREELFDKLYSFFRRYFSESGSIYFRYTPLHQNVYERVYTDDRDVMLFWKTHMLYYVKTDRIFNSLNIEVDGVKFFFDASNMELKKANEKRQVVFDFRSKTSDGTLVFDVYYSDKGRATRIDDILKAVKKAGGKVDDETINRAMRIFEKQSEVDYFINKNARAFLQEQFDLWLYQYLFAGQNIWSSERLAQLQALKAIAFKVIDFISQFEDELVKIWNKPKFVFNSHYVITLDRILNPNRDSEDKEAIDENHFLESTEKRIDLLERIFTHPGIQKQVEEWRSLGMIPEDFEPEDVVFYASKQNDPYTPNLFDYHSVRDGHLVRSPYHLPYNPKLVERARELRKNMTTAERKLWSEFLRNFRYPVLRQRPIDQYIVDFYCAKLKLVIEIDGESHYTEEGKEYDEQRTAVLESYGLRVLRFTNLDVLHNIEAVCQQIEETVPPETGIYRTVRESQESSIYHVGSEESPRTPLDKGGLDESPRTPFDKGGTVSAPPLLRGAGGDLHPIYQYLPLDTCHFPDLELDILALFDDLDASLDGWLVHSENYQALITLLPKFKEKIQTVYIDPPFNLGSNADYQYIVNYKDATWISMVENRIQIARQFLHPLGSVFFRCDYNGNMFIRMLLKKYLPVFKNEIIVKRTRTLKGEPGRFHTATDTLFFTSSDPKATFYGFRTIKPQEEWKWVDMHLPGSRKDEELLYRYFFGKRIKAPNGRRWALSQDAIENATSKGLIKMDEETGMPKFLTKWDTIGSNWSDIPGYSPTWGFTTENSEVVLQRVIESTSREKEIVFDFFVGIGTTIATAHKMKRRWIGIEMGSHFDNFYIDKNGDLKTGVLGRMKEVLSNHGNHEPSGITKVVNWKGGGFFKYYHLEQYEDVLRRAHYADADLFVNPYEDPYHSYVFLPDLKLLDSLEIDYEKNAVHFRPDRLYPSADGEPRVIDLAETLSNLRGKWIKRITAEYVEFQDGERVNLIDPDWRLFKPLIWWQ